jgi:hypothetical protein
MNAKEVMDIWGHYIQPPPPPPLEFFKKQIDNYAIKHEKNAPHQSYSPIIKDPLIIWRKILGTLPSLLSFFSVAAIFKNNFLSNFLLERFKLR